MVLAGLALSVVIEVIPARDVCDSLLGIFVWLSITADCTCILLQLHVIYVRLLRGVIPSRAGFIVRVKG